MEIIKLNLIPTGVNPTCHVKQYDTGRVIRFELFEGLTPYTLQSGDTVTLNLRKPDNTIIESSVTATQGNKYVDLTTTEQMCAVVGYTLGTFKIANGSVDIGTLNFIMQVERDVLADGIASQSVIEDLDALVQEAVGDNYYTKTEVDSALDLKADKSTTYTKTQVDSALALKADASNVYTKSQTDSALALKANSADVYTKSETDTALNAKANASDVYTKSEVDADLALKADKSNTYTKTEVDNALALKLDKSEFYNSLPSDTVSGSIASFTDGADTVPVKSLIAQIVAQQAGSGDPSPSNVRAISGFTACNISKSGSNLWDEVWELGGIDATTGENTTSSTTIRSKNYIPVKENINVYLVTSKIIRFRWYDSNKTIIGNQQVNSSGVVTIPSGTAYARFVVIDETTYQNNISLNYPSTDTSYHAYSGETKQISFGSAGTVYGGNLNVTTGLLTITHGFVDLGSLNWTRAGNTNRFYADISDGASSIVGGRDAVCEKYITFKGVLADMPDKSITTFNSNISGANGRVFVLDTAYTDATDFKTAMSGNHLVYELATPTTVQLTPTEVKTLLGTNNIFADTGDVAVNYRADIGLYIDKKISQIPAPL